MTRILFMPDKIIRTGLSPVYDEHNNLIANIQYHYFSLKRKLELLDPENKVISKGNVKLFSFRPTWKIFSPDDESIGTIKRLFTVLSHNFIYENNKNESFKIEGNFLARNYTIYKNNEVVVKVTGSNNLISLHAHSFQVEILDDSLDKFEVINLIEGIRSLVEISHNN